MMIFSNSSSNNEIPIQYVFMLTFNGNFKQLKRYTRYLTKSLSRARIQRLHIYIYINVYPLCPDIIFVFVHYMVYVRKIYHRNSSAFFHIKTFYLIWRRRRKIQRNIHQHQFRSNLSVNEFPYLYFKWKLLCYSLILYEWILCNLFRSATQCFPWTM